ncbi:MAG: T9SS type A sorting domain-containing protein [Chitinophagales bacterium]|nr:T9SS type A sorting domain-containing protein [Chitinophagales bacterium]
MSLIYTRTRQWCICSIVLFLTSVQCSSGYNVTKIAATYRSGQVFITWKNPAIASNVQYNIYRSSLPIVTDLSTATFMGYVRDSSSKNMRRSHLNGKDVFFKISDAAAPLASNIGVYAITCTDNKPYYYTVTVKTLSDGLESVKIKVGTNTLKKAIAETVADPQPVYQDSVKWTSGDIVKYYVWFGNNQNLPNFPAMVNCGSYGFNFYILKRGTATRYPVFLLYEGLDENSLRGNGLDVFGNETNCYIIGLDDWLPIPIGSGVDAGKGTFWTGYQENFDIYAASNAVPSTGLVKTYSQTRFIHTLDWANKYLPSDSTRVYTVGVSAGGFGAFMTGIIVPKKIAAMYTVVEPVFVKSYSESDDEMWGTSKTNLLCDLTNPATGQPLHIFELMDFKKMALYEKQLGWPLVFSIQGKPDPSIGWQDKPKFFDSVQANQQGGVYFWDQRVHDGSGANFSDNETTPDFFRYQTNKSYPAFSHCSADQDAGDGTISVGDPFGAINGYLDWEDDITDQSCNWSANVYSKDLLVGGLPLLPLYSYCYSDITLRRLQNFHPLTGTTIKWYNVDASTDTIQSGSFLYDGKLFRLTGMRVNKSGNQIIVKSSGCSRDEQELSANKSTEQNKTLIVRTNSGWKVQLNTDNNQPVEWMLYDVSGHLLASQKISCMAGVNEFEVSAITRGVYLLRIKGTSYSHSEKIMF